MIGLLGIFALGGVNAVTAPDNTGRQIAAAHEENERVLAELRELRAALTPRSFHYEDGLEDRVRDYAAAARDAHTVWH